MDTGSTWTEDGKKRQAGPLVGLRRLYTCTPGRIGGVPITRNNTCTRIPLEVNYHLRGRPHTSSALSCICDLSLLL
jgi:hypothetical protein